MKFLFLGQVDYASNLQAMQSFTLNRGSDTPDEIWFCQHPPVFTLGRHSDAAHLFRPAAVPVVESDRGGEVTYHGPGQLMMYCLINLKRRGQGPAQWVQCLEAAVLDLLAEYSVEGHLRPGMPGVYVRNQKIASLGLRIRNGCSYHGLALNVDMDLTPFEGIHPCGYADLKMTQLVDCLRENDKFLPNDTISAVKSLAQNALLEKTPSHVGSTLVLQVREKLVSLMKSRL